MPYDLRPGAARLRGSRRDGRARRSIGALLALVLLVLALPACGGPGGATPSPSPTRPLRVLIFGDSYTYGAGAEPVTNGYAYQVGAKLGWDVTVDGFGGTGYVAHGPAAGGTFVSRIKKAPPGPFDLVVLQGSSNDERQPLAKLGPAIDATLDATRARYPDARIIMMGPVPLFGSVPQTKRDVNDTLREHASQHGIAFVDPVAEIWFTRGESKTMVNPRDGHPSNLGHERMRDRFVLDMVRLTGARRVG